jgi:hypothetical protein
LFYIEVQDVKQTCYILVALLRFVGVTLSCIVQVQRQDCWPPAKGDFQLLEDTKHVQRHHQGTDIELNLRPDSRNKEDGKS